MKTFRIMKLALLVILLCLSACSGGDDEPIEPTPKPEVVKSEITIDSNIISNGLSFSDAKGEQSISFTTNENWTLSVASTTSGAAWCTASATSGTKGSASVKFTVTENTDYENRCVSVTIKSASASKTFTITQKGADALLVSTDKYEVGQEGSTIEIEVKANIDYKMEISEEAKDWIKEFSSRTLTTFKHKLEIAMNEDTEEREGEIYFKSGDKTETITIIQEGNEGNIPYLTFTANEKQTFTMSKAVATLEYSVNNSKEWKELGINTVDFGGELGSLRIRGNNSIGTGINYNDYSNVVFKNNVEVLCTGDIRTLIDYKNYKNANTVNARFYGLFNNCVILTTAPELPATTLANKCYSHMFYNCKSLTTVPELPATYLSDECYSQMFTGCSSLTTAPKLPATTLADYCYFNMFAGCSSLTTAPELPATTLADYCYTRMFEECTSLTVAPELPANELKEHCYSIMFSGCTSLTTVSKLHAERLAYGCYWEMFKKCTSLTTAPGLPAKNLAQRCYYEMFAGCSSLTTAPELPATTLADYCYYGMFSDCISLTTVPELPAKFLISNCYNRMFFNCIKLNNIIMLATDISASDCLTYWTYNVASKGTFTKAKEIISLPKGNNGIPEGWTIKNYGEE